MRECRYCNLLIHNENGMEMKLFIEFSIAILEIALALLHVIAALRV